MPVNDIDGNTIVYNNDFPDNLQISNMEIGAGKTAFGKKFFPQCYLTERKDSKVKKLPHFEDVPAYSEDGKCHFIDEFQNLEELKKLERKFERIICCNPFGYGFGTLDATLQMLNNVGSALVDGGELFVIGNKSNKYCDIKKFERFYEQCKEELSFEFEITDQQVLKPTDNYIANHTYYYCDMIGTTIPNICYTLTKKDLS